MHLEPLPLFDCVFCVKHSKMVFEKLSERALHKKYAKIMSNHQRDPHHTLSEHMVDEDIEKLLTVEDDKGLGT
jgi:hypothetical protein